MLEEYARPAVVRKNDEHSDKGLIKSVECRLSILNTISIDLHAKKGVDEDEKKHKHRDIREILNRVPHALKDLVEVSEMFHKLYKSDYPKHPQGCQSRALALR